MRRASGALAAVLLVLLLHVQSGTDLTLGQQWQALTGAQPGRADYILYVHSLWPRSLLAILLGAAMALSGALLQLLTRNVLAAPMTLGLSSASWCAIVLCGLLLPHLQLPLEWTALGGATLALLLIGRLAGWQGLSGMPAIIAGTALNLLLGNIAALALMMHDQYARSLLVWGAGNLAQNDGYWLHWVWPRLLPALMLLPFLLRPLQLLQLGPAAATSAGLDLRRSGLLIVGLALWLNSVAIAAVGLISFVSLLAPNAARLLGARTATGLLALSAVAGAVLLGLADILAMVLSTRLADVLPTSAAVAIIGAPLMILLCLRQPIASGTAMTSTSRPLLQLPRALLILLALSLIMLALLLGRSVDGHWQLHWPDAMIWQLRWPRALAAMAAGAGMALAGALLQRLLGNALASPELLGISAGASMGLLAGLLLALPLSPYLCAAAGAMAILLALLWLAPRHGPGTLILLGTALSALLEALVQFVLAQGTQDSLRLLNWLAGSIWQVRPQQALLLSALIVAFGGAALLAQRLLDMLSLGDASARAAGVDLRRARLLLLVLAGGLTLVVCAQFGPLSFIGLLVPQLAAQLGLRRTPAVLACSALLGMVLMAMADAASRTLLFPMQLPSGALVAVLCGLLLIGTLLRRPGASLNA